jgi:hypothetical protein
VYSFYDKFMKKIAIFSKKFSEKRGVILPFASFSFVPSFLPFLFFFLSFFQC